MSAEAALVARLESDGAVTSLVGTRIYPMQMPQSAALPAITYQRIGTNPDQALRGYAGLDHPRIQVDAWATTFTTAQALGNAVRDALDHYRTSSLATLFLDGRPLLSADGLRHRVQQDFRVSIEGGT